MRFVVDECTGPRVARWLTSHGHEVVSIYDSYRGAADAFVMQLAVEQNRVIVTNDKDFGDHVFRNGEPHCGVILLRLADERAANKIARLAFLLAQFPHSIDERFIVVTDKGFRVASR